MCTSLIDFAGLQPASSITISGVRIPSGELHLWTIDLDAAGDSADASAQLSGSERERAAAFKFERDRSRYVSAHVALRRILSRYAGVPPEAIRYGSGPQGKPYLDQAPEERGIAFNLTHSEGFAMVAVAWKREVGVDLECLRPRPDVLPIASHYFHGREIDYLRQVPASAASDAFLRLWTMKEAYIKCVGMGLSLPLDSFSVLDENLRKEYVIASIEAPADFVGAVAYPAPALEHISLSAG